MQCDFCSLKVSLPWVVCAGDLLGAGCATTCPRARRRWEMEWGWGVTIFLCDLSLPTGTLGFPPGGPKRFGLSQSSTQRKVFYSTHLG